MTAQQETCDRVMRHSRNSLPHMLCYIAASLRCRYPYTVDRHVGGVDSALRPFSRHCNREPLV